MDVKKKLVELIQRAVGGCARHWAEIIADHLMANGVTVQGDELPTNCNQLRWIPVTERLPEKWMLWINDEHCEPMEFIVMIKGAELPTVLCFDGESFCDYNHTEFYPVTHWRPMPDPPKGERLCRF